MVQIVDSDNRNNLVKLEKDSLYCFWAFEWYSLASRSIEINGNLCFTQHWDLTLCFNCWNDNFKDKNIQWN